MVVCAQAIYFLLQNKPLVAAIHLWLLFIFFITSKFIGQIFSFFFLSSLSAFPWGLQGQKLEIKPSSFTVFHHIDYFAWIKSQAIPSKILNVIGRGGILLDILGLEDTFSSSWPQSSKASKPTSPRKCPVLGSRTALLFNWLKKKKRQHIWLSVNSLFLFVIWKNNTTW